MTIDSTGREHRPAGSPASTGGQFAAQQAPAAAASLTVTQQTFKDEAEFGQIDREMGKAAAHVALASSARRIRESLDDYPWIRAVHFKVNEYAGDYEADSLRVAVHDDETDTTEVVDLHELGDGAVDSAIGQEIVQLGMAVDKLDGLGGNHVLDLSEDGIEQHDRDAIDYAAKAHNQLQTWVQAQRAEFSRRDFERIEQADAEHRRIYGAPSQDGPF